MALDVKLYKQSHVFKLNTFIDPEKKNTVIWNKATIVVKVIEQKYVYYVVLNLISTPSPTHEMYLCGLIQIPSDLH